MEKEKVETNPPRPPPDQRLADKLLNETETTLNLIFDDLPDKNMESMLVDSLYQFYETRKSGTKFLNWAVRSEVVNRELPEELFKLATPTTQVMMHFMFDERGVNFMKEVLVPVINKIRRIVDREREKERDLLTASSSSRSSTSTWDTSDYSISEREKDGDSVSQSMEALDIMSEMSTTPDASVKEAEQVPNPVLLLACDEIIDNLQENLASFPLFMREGLLTLHEECIKKHPKVDNIVPVVLFLRFICPTLVQPTVFGLLEDTLSAAAFQTTLLVTRIVQHIALSCSTELKKKLDPKLPNRLDDKEVKKYIENNTPKVKDFAEKVIDGDNIAFCRKMINASVKRVDPPKELLDETLQRVHDVLVHIDKLKRQKKLEKNDNSDSKNLSDLIPLNVEIAELLSPRGTNDPTEKKPSASDRDVVGWIPPWVRRRVLQDINGVQYTFGDIMADNGKTCLVLLRHFGVTCRRSADRLTQIHNYFQRLGVHLVAIGSGTAKMAMDFKQHQNFAGQIYVDPSRTIYEDLNCKRGWKAALFNMKVLKSVKTAFKEGYRQGKTQGDMTQNGGLFVIEGGDRVLYEHVEAFAGDHPDLKHVLTACGASEDMLSEYQLNIVTPKQVKREAKKRMKDQKRLEKEAHKQRMKEYKERKNALKKQLDIKN